MEERAGALIDLAQTPIDHRYKGIPLGAALPLCDVGTQGWNVAYGDLALPVTTLRASAVQHNLDTMAEFCRRNDVLLAPHGKTTMSPQLFERQLRAGAWGITAATPTQVAVMRQFGVPRILLANEISEPAAIRWIAGELETDESFEFMCLVDDQKNVADLDDALDGVISARRLQVLVEVGMKGGRAGVRSAEHALEVARAVAASRHLTLAGIETYEGLVTSGIAPEDLSQVDALCERVGDIIRQIAADGLFGAPMITVTAGGSAYFDRVVAEFAKWRGSGLPLQLVLRSGCYVTQDLGKYQRVSPLDGRRDPSESLHLENALEGWARVLSRPEPELAILGTGKRDLPYDADLPVPLTSFRNGVPVSELRSSAKIFKMMDQHAFVSVPAEIELEPGDVVTLGMSHPCTAFDKLRLVPMINDDHVVVDAVLTFF
jgi:D-serine dehydratase